MIQWIGLPSHYRQTRAPLIGCIFGGLVGLGTSLLSNSASKYVRCSKILKMLFATSVFCKRFSVTRFFLLQFFVSFWSSRYRSCESQTWKGKKKWIHNAKRYVLYHVLKFLFLPEKAPRLWWIPKNIKTMMDAQWAIRVLVWSIEFFKFWSCYCYCN